MKTINTDLLDAAILFAVNAHRGMERRGKGFPYIVHPMETVAIVSTMTGDQELLAAAALHDTVEDCGVTPEELKEKFGAHVAALVVSESSEQIKGKTQEESWRERKQIAIDRLRSASRDAKIVALGDKLSNMRSIARDYAEIGDELWQRFHSSDPKDHAWHYRGLADALSELSDTAAYKEFVSIIDSVFSNETTAEKEPLPELDMSQWKRTGEGHTAESFEHMDGKTMMKLYFDFVPDALIKQELRVAEAAYGMGIPTPRPGEMVRCGNRWGCSFERIDHKRSFARAIADEPERLEEYAERFALMAKKLHATPCDKSVFPSYREKLSEIIQKQNLLSEAEKEKLLRFLNHAEDTGTCIHGDLHLGNVITDGTVDLFIDMGDFSYGNPLFDLGALYLMSTIVPEERVMGDYHISRAVQQQFWERFLRYYFGADTKEKLAEITQMLRPYAAMQALIFLEHDASDVIYERFIHEVLE